MSSRTVTIDDLEGWLLSGAHWRVVEICDGRVAVDMCTCSGEPMARVESGDPSVIGYLRTAHPELDAS